MKDVKDYVCTLEQAKRLKELGVNQDSLYMYNLWTHDDGSFETELVATSFLKKLMGITRGVTFNMADVSQDEYPRWAAFTSQELAEIISNQCRYFIQKDGFNTFYALDRRAEYGIEFRHELIRYELPLKNIKSEAQVRAEFLIYLLENTNEKTQM
jgi:hypothetical protein